MREISLILAGIMAICAMAAQRKRGRAASVITGAGFFVVSCYVDGIFGIIVENGAGEGWKMPLQWVGIFASKSMLLVVLLLIVLGTLRRGGENSQSPEESQCGWGYMEGLTLGVSLFFGILAWWVQEAGEGVTDFEAVLFMMFLLAVLTGYYAFSWFYGRELQRRGLQRESDARRAEADRYLEGVENHYEMTRELWHDLKNHLNLLNLLLQEGKHEQMADYLRILGEDVDSLTLPVKSGNLVVDALLADKAARARRERIQVEISLCDLTGLALRPHEICGLLGNLLDNALEANLLVSKERFLRVTCRDRSDCYYIKVENAFAERPEKKGEGIVLESGKSDRRNRVGHGLGLRSAERIVHGWGGDLIMESGGDRFAVVVRLPKGWETEANGTT